MTRILSRLAAFNLLVLLTAFVVGWISFSRGSLRNPDDRTYLLHVYLGLIAVITSLAVHGLIFIYFLGTGRWVKEVAIAYRIPDQPLPKLTRELSCRHVSLGSDRWLVPHRRCAVAGRRGGNEAMGLALPFALGAGEHPGQRVGLLGRVSQCRH